MVDVKPQMEVECSGWSRHLTMTNALVDCIGRGGGGLIKSNAFSAPKPPIIKINAMAELAKRLGAAV